MLKACFNHKNTEWLLFYVFIQLLIQINKSLRGKNSQYQKHSLDGWWIKGKTQIVDPKNKEIWWVVQLCSIFGGMAWSP